MGIGDSFVLVVEVVFPFPSVTRLVFVKLFWPWFGLYACLSDRLS